MQAAIESLSLVHQLLFFFVMKSVCHVNNFFVQIVRYFRFIAFGRFLPFLILEICFHIDQAPEERECCSSMLHTWQIIALRTSTAVGATVEWNFHYVPHKTTRNPQADASFSGAKILCIALSRAPGFVFLASLWAVAGSSSQRETTKKFESFSTLT